MTPERIAELKEQAVLKSIVPIESWELLDLLAVAEREVVLREAAADLLCDIYSGPNGEDIISGDSGSLHRIRAALETKGGESNG